MRNRQALLARPPDASYSLTMITAVRDQPHFANLAAAIAAVACCDIATGLTLQLLPLILESQGYSARLIGFNAAMGPIGVLLAGPLLPGIVGRLGSQTVAFAAVGLIILSLALFQILPYVAAWFPIRFLMGAAIGTLFTISEAWVLTFAGDKARGRVMGIYTSMLAVTFAAGPLLLPFTGISGWAPWLIGMVCVAFSAVPLAFVNASDVDFNPKEKGGFLRFLKRAPYLLVAVAAVTIFDSVFISFFAIFAMRSGLEMSIASAMLGVAVISNVFLLTPLGMLGDRWSKPGVMLLSAIATILLSLALPTLISGIWAWPVTMLLSATAFGPYIIALSMLGDNFQGPELIAGTATFAAMWGIGGLIGPPIAGTAIDAFGVGALPFTFAVFHVLLLGCLVISRGHLIRDAGHAVA